MLTPTSGHITVTYYRNILLTTTVHTYHHPTAHCKKSIALLKNWYTIPSPPFLQPPNTHTYMYMPLMGLRKNEVNEGTKGLNHPSLNTQPGYRYRHCMKARSHFRSLHKSTHTNNAIHSLACESESRKLLLQLLQQICINTHTRLVDGPGQEMK